MQVKIEKKFEVKEPVERVWALLSDPTKVVASVPGAKITEKVDDQNYKGSISVKVGPAVTDYKGEVHILSMDPIAHRMEIEGKGQDVRGKGSASMKMSGELRVLPDGTEVITTSEVSIVGLLAQFGGRMINDVSNKIFEEFTKSFRAQLAEIPATTAAPPGSGQLETPRENESSREPGTAAGATPNQIRLTQPEPKPIKALPLILSIFRDAFVRFIRRIFGRSAEF